MSVLKRLLTRNVGPIDRIIRALPALVVLALWAGGVLSGTALVVAGIAAAMLFFTALTARCSIYAMLGLSTCPAPSKSG